MSNGLKTPAPNIVRVRLQVLRNYHTPVLRAGEERLRAAMAEYAATCVPTMDGEASWRGVVCGTAGR